MNNLAQPREFDFSRLNLPFPPTAEQRSIVNAAVGTTDNLLVQALAGAAKTSTLELIARAVTGIPVLCVAFNKRIAEEMAKRLPSHCVCKTMNSLGHQAWGAHLGKRLSLDTRKTGKIVKDLSLSRSEQLELEELFGDVVQLVGKAKTMGYVPEGRYAEATHLVSRATLEEALADAEHSSLAWSLLDQILIRSINQAYDGIIDFDDQIYMSVLFNAGLPKFPLVLVDEAQDLSPLNHFMIQRLVTKRLIAVGDEFQSIYAFRGAISDGMSVLRQKFSMVEHRLSISFRCPKSVIELARRRAPYMQWADHAIDGAVIDLTRREALDSPFGWGPSLIPPHGVIICRNNAPLMGLGLKLLRAGRGITMRGFDVSKKLVKILREFGDTDMPQHELLTHLDRWRSAKLAEAKLKPETVQDRYECLTCFAEATHTLGEAIAHAEALFAAEGPIELLSGHKSKGLEWDDVFHLDPWRIPSSFAKGREELTQERNIEYVITTRAKRTLTLLNLEDYDPEI